MVLLFMLRSVRLQKTNRKLVIGRMKMTDREMEDMLDEIFRKVFKEDW
tara:strand:+ start:11655 stop:11798 length:144 start_codon:yes stop_codon:yes gene_type:complete